MRTKNLFSGLLMLALSTSAFAQLTTTHVANSTDTTTAGEKPTVVTVGARIPFATESSTPIWQLQAQGVLASQSVWKWQITNGPGGTTFYAADGVSALTPATNDLGVEDLTGLGFVKDSAISIDFQNVGTLDLWVTERTVSNISGITGCEGDIEHLSVQVVNAPTVAFNDADRIMGGCGADAAPNNDIPLTVSGNGYFSAPASGGGLRITYKIDYTNLAGVTTPEVPTTTVNDGDEITTGWAQFSVNNGPTNIVIPFNISNGNFGTYTVTLEAVTDEVSRKTLDAVPGYDTQGLPVVAQRTLKIYALPTPNTQPIKHIQNIGW
ncbi:MAG: hypothetical protein N2662_07135 [Bacteroidales bacterium]|nr:hypothetical protein [Bacteroidales bacterium]